MALPPRHDYYCIQYAMSGLCPICHPQPTCKNCGHTASQHLYTDEPAKFGWCPNCQGCGPEQEEQVMTLPQPPRRVRVDGQTLSPCKHHESCGNRVGEGETECTSCQNITRSWNANTPMNQHPRNMR
jgi:hypothetical protein